MIRMSTEENKETCQEVEQVQGGINVANANSQENMRPPPPRFPPSAFFLFKAKIEYDFSGTQAEILSEIAKEWRYLEDEEKLEYEKQAEAARTQYFEDVKKYEEQYGKIEKKKRREWRYLDDEEKLEYENDVKKYEEQYRKIEKKKRRPPPSPPLTPKRRFLKEVGDGLHDFDIVREHYEGMESEYECDYKDDVEAFNEELKEYKKEFGEDSTYLEEIILSDDSSNEDSD